MVNCRYSRRSLKNVRGLFVLQTSSVTRTNFDKTNLLIVAHTSNHARDKVDVNLYKNRTFTCAMLLVEASHRSCGAAVSSPRIFHTYVISIQFIASVVLSTYDTHVRCVAFSSSIGSHYHCLHKHTIYNSICHERIANVPDDGQCSDRCQRSDRCPRSYFEMISHLRLLVFAGTPAARLSFNHSSSAARI